MLKIAVISIFLATTGSLFAACDKLMTLDDHEGHIFGYVIPQDIRALSGNSTTTHILLVSGSSIDVPISVIYVYERLKINCPGM